MLAAKKKISLRTSRLPHRRSAATHLRKMSEALAVANTPGGSTCHAPSRKYINAEKKLNANVDFYSAST